MEVKKSARAKWYLKRGAKAGMQLQITVRLDSTILSFGLVWDER